MWLIRYENTTNLYLVVLKYIVVEDVLYIIFMYCKSYVINNLNI